MTVFHCSTTMVPSVEATLASYGYMITQPWHEGQHGELRIDMGTSETTITITQPTDATEARIEVDGYAGNVELFIGHYLTD